MWFVTLVIGLFVGFAIGYNWDLIKYQYKLRRELIERDAERLHRDSMEREPLPRRTQRRWRT
jgi:hypothetical protein